MFARRLPAPRVRRAEPPSRLPDKWSPGGHHRRSLLARRTATSCCRSFLAATKYAAVETYRRRHGNIVQHYAACETRLKKSDTERLDPEDRTAVLDRSTQRKCATQRRCVLLSSSPVFATFFPKMLSNRLSQPHDAALKKPVEICVREPVLLIFCSLLDDVWLVKCG